MKGKLFRFSAGNSRKKPSTGAWQIHVFQAMEKKKHLFLQNPQPKSENAMEMFKAAASFSPQSLLLKIVWKQNLSTWSGGEFPSFPPLLLMWGVHYSSWGGPPQKNGGAVGCSYGFFSQNSEKKTNLGHKNPPISRDAPISRDGYVLQ